MPRFEQVFVCPAASMDQGSFQRALFLARRRAEIRLADGEESTVTLIWLAKVLDGAVASWTLIEDTPHHRTRLGLSG